MQFVLVIYHGSERSFSEEEKKAAHADYAALNNMKNVTGCPPRWVCRRTRQCSRGARLGRHHRGALP